MITTNPLVSLDELVEYYGDKRVLLVARRPSSSIAEKDQTLSSPEVIASIEGAIDHATSLIEALLPCFNDHIKLARGWARVIAMYQLTSTSVAKLSTAEVDTYKEAVRQIELLAKRCKATEEVVVDPENPIRPRVAPVAKCGYVKNDWDFKREGF